MKWIRSRRRMNWDGVITDMHDLPRISWENRVQYRVSLLSFFPFYNNFEIWYVMICAKWTCWDSQKVTPRTAVGGGPLGFWATNGLFWLLTTGTESSLNSLVRVSCHKTEGNGGGEGGDVYGFQRFDLWYIYLPYCTGWKSAMQWESWRTTSSS